MPDIRQTASPPNALLHRSLPGSATRRLMVDAPPPFLGLTLTSLFGHSTPLGSFSGDLSISAVPL